MNWSGQQVQALDKVGSWIKSKSKPFFMLAGYAGTGKTTIARHLVESVQGAVYFAAYTGKAAYVLTKSGCTNVSTIHKLIYLPKDKCKVRLKELEAERSRLMTHKPLPETLLKKVDAAINAEKQNLSRPMFQLNNESPLLNAGLLVVDEYSMIDEQMGADLLSFGCPVLALGDPGQLPPVYGNPYFKGQPDFLLTEIHRQAADNPIIWMSREVREGRSLKPGNYGESLVIPYGKMDKENLRQSILGADQLLVGRNKTRASSNARVRQLLGYENPLPVKNDKLVCLRNNHEIGLLNGQIWTSRDDSVFDGDYAILDLQSEEGATVQLSSHINHFNGTKIDFWSKKDAEEFDYGYALTVHKSQGSQWPNVTLLDEWHNQDRQKWLYTAITRAANKIDLVQM
jgi:exodeoxyribonuclease-5